MLRIIISDKSVLFREGLISLFQDEPGIQVVGEADSGALTMELAEIYKPDVILMDTHLSDGGGIDAMRRILTRQPGISFVILSADESDEMFMDVIRSGARGFLCKNISKSTLVSSLKALERGESIVPRKFISGLLDEIARPGNHVAASNSDGDVSALSFRELEVLRCLGNMFSNREIASQLFISENTVRVHVHSILEKLHFRNRHQVAEYVRRLGLFE